MPHSSQLHRNEWVPPRLRGQHSPQSPHSSAGGPPIPHTPNHQHRACPIHAQSHPAWVGSTEARTLLPRTTKSPISDPAHPKRPYPRSYCVLYPHPVPTGLKRYQTSGTTTSSPSAATTACPTCRTTAPNPYSKQPSRVSKRQKDERSTAKFFLVARHLRRDNRWRWKRSAFLLHSGITPLNFGQPAWITCACSVRSHGARLVRPPTSICWPTSRLASASPF